VAAADYLALAPAAIGVMLVGFAEGLGAAKTYAVRHHYEVDANRELLGLGAANLGAGLSSGMVVNGSLSKTAVNGSAGACSQVSGLVVAALTVVTLLFLTGLFESLPEATLAAVVIAAVIELVDIPALVELYRVATRQLRGIYGVAARPDFLAALAALGGVLVFDTLPGLFIGVLVSLLLLLYRASRPHVAVLGQVPGAAVGQYGDVRRHPENRQLPGIVILRLEIGLFFANADAVRGAVRAHAFRDGIRAVVLDAETIPMSTSPLPGRWSSSTTSWPAGGCGWSWPATSVRSATCCAAPRRTGPCSPPTRPCSGPSTPSGRPPPAERARAGRTSTGRMRLLAVLAAGVALATRRRPAGERRRARLAGFGALALAGMVVFAAAVPDDHEGPP
jgi:MFS superfamily sulfate permease-like transporter